MTTEALPDFDGAVAGPPLMFPIAGSPGAFGVLPARLTIGVAAGAVDLSLDIFRGDRPGAGTAVLVLGCDVEYDTETALASARQLDPRATVQGLPWSAGALWLDIPHASGGRIVSPTSFTPSGVGTGRVVMPVALDDAELLASLLEGTSPTTGSLSATAVVVVSGTGARAPAVVRFDPVDVAGDLAAAGLTEVDPATLGAHWHVAPAWLTIDPAPPASATAGQIMAAFSARVCAQLCTWDPTAGSARQGSFVVGAQPTGHGVMLWDLSQPAIIGRPVPLVLEPADLARIIAADGSALVHRVAPPPLDLGLVTVPVFSQLPSPLAGTLAVGVTVRAPARMPLRPFDIVRSVESDAAGRFPTVTFDRGAGAGLGGPDDPLLVSGYAVVTAPDGARRTAGPERAAERDFITVHEADLGAQVAVVELSEPLRALATAGVTGQRPGLDPVVVGLDAPPAVAALVGPASGQPPGEVRIMLTSRADGTQLSVGPLPWSDVRLDVSDLATFGVQTVRIRADLPDGTGVVAVDLQPEPGPAVPAPLTATIQLHAGATERAWAYTASCPFHAGYRYRLTASPGDTPQPWSAVMDPRRPLVVTVPPGTPASGGSG